MIRKVMTFARVALLAAAPLAISSMAMATDISQSWPAPTAADIPAGTWTLDLTHSSLTFRVIHMGMSHYTARFTQFDATLDVDPNMPAAARVAVTVDPHSLQTDYPLKTPDFNAELQGPEWLDVAKYPQITFHTTKVDVTGKTTAHLTGDLTLHGATHPVTLDVTLNGAYASLPIDPHGSRVGFSAHGVFKRSDFGVSAALYHPGNRVGISDEVDLVIEAEFTRAADHK